MLPLTKREGIGPRPEPADRFEPVPGAIVAEKYRIDRTLGEGGMGVVVAATHLALEQPVAIKFLLPEAMRSQVAVERFLREARVAAKIRNEHVARVHDVGTLDGDVPYIVMEYLVGGDLGDVLADEGALPIEQACEIALQACEALAEVHAAGIVHRDLKPSNLFVTRRADGSPVVKLLDFGISKLTLGMDDASADPALTATATIMGSPSYMSPEQLKSTKEVDARADVWSLGAVLYEALTGKPAFRGETVPQVCAMIASEDPRPPSAHREGIPPELDAAVLRALAKDVEQRIPLVELAEVLARFAPDRARSSLERIEAVLGESARSRPPPVGSKDAKDALPVLPLATAERNRTVSAWGRERRGRSAGGGALALLVLAVGGVLGIAWITGNVDVPRLRGRIAGATSLVNSAASAVTSAVSSVVGSSLPNGMPLPPAPSASVPAPLSAPVPPSSASVPVPPSSAAAESVSGAAGEATDDGAAAADEAESDDAEAPAAASPPPGASRPASLPAAGAHSPPARTHVPKTKHSAKPLHRHH